MDTWPKRMSNLERKVMELEKKVEKLERRNFEEKLEKMEIGWYKNQMK